jgi:hypothetical protein
MVATVASCGGGGGGGSTIAASPSITAALDDKNPMGNTGPCEKGDLTGWTTPQPSAVDRSKAFKSLQQPGSRLYYISNAGSDSAGDIYFWDGSQIIDAAGQSKNAQGQAYGSDPMNPTAAVKAFKRWAFVAPRQDANADIGSRAIYGTPSPTMRAGYPDWWLFKRGETFDLAQDMVSFAKETDPSAAYVNASLSVSGGRSATERQIVGAYGSLCDARPRLTHPQLGFITRFNSPVFKDVAYLSLHFDGHDRPAPTAAGTPSYTITLLYQENTAKNILFEDMWMDGLAINISAGSSSNGAQVTFKRSLLTDSFGPDRTQGIYYSGSRQGQLRIEDSILMRNGFLIDPQKSWPPSGTNTWNIYSRNMYLSGEADNMNSALVNSVSLIGASGDQFRQGMRVERNFFYQGYVTMGAHGGYPDAQGATGSMTDNVLQRFKGTGTDDDRGHPGWGLSLTSGAQGVEVARNIVTGVQHAGEGSAFALTALSWYCYAHTFHQATRNNAIHHNIFEASNSTAIEVSDGVTGEETLGCANWTSPGVKQNTVANNVLISPRSTAGTYTPVGAAVGTSNDTAYSANSLYTSRTAAAAALSWPNPQRSLKTHLQANNITVKSADGFNEYHALASQMRKGQWMPQLTGKALVNHVRGGFGVVALP